MSAYLEQASPKKLAGLGFILSLTPLYFVAAAVLKYGFGAGLLFDPLAAFFADPLRLRVLNLVITPVLFFGGLIVALALNLYAVFRLKRKAGDDNASGRSGGGARGWNVAVVVLSSLLLATITVYGILENFTRR
jgi:hypothetical protein